MYAKRQSKTLSAIPTNANEKGIVLVGTIALVAILAVFGTLGIVTTSTELIISKNHKTSVQARYVAEAGIHRTIGMINSSPGWLDGINPAINAFLGDNFFGNGKYEVNVYENEPTIGKIRILTTGEVNGSTTTFEAIVSSKKYGILDYASFSCFGLDLKDTDANEITGDVYVSGDLNLAESGIQLITGDVQATNDIVIGGTSYITGNAYANNHIDMESSADPNITGTATAGLVDGSGTAGDIVITTDPVASLCSVDDLAAITITFDEIQAFRDNADPNQTFFNYEFSEADNFAGIVYVENDFELTADSTFSDNVVFVVDRNVDISGSLTSNPPDMYSVIFLVPNGNFKVKGGTDIDIDATIIVGTVNPETDTKQVVILK